MLHVTQLGGFGAGQNSLTSIAYQASAVSGTSTITCPTVQLYDVGVLFDLAFSASSTDFPTEVVPSGFSILRSDTAVMFTGYRGTVSYKVFNGGESGSTLTGQSSDGMGKTLLVFRPNGVIQTVTSSTWTGELTSGNPGAQAISASGQQAPLIRLAFASVNVASTPDFSAGTFDATVTNTILARQRAGYAIQNSSPSDDSVDMTDYGNNWLTAGWLRFS